jgi:hypothetical protein
VAGDSRVSQPLLCVFAYFDFCFFQLSYGYPSLPKMVGRRAGMGLYDFIIIMVFFLRATL